MSPVVLDAGTTVTAVAELARVKLTATAAPTQTGVPNTEFLRFVTLVDGEWIPVRGYDRVDAEPGTVREAFYYEADPNTEQLFAVQSGWSLSGADIVSARSATASVTMGLSSSWLKDLFDPTANMAVEVFRGRGRDEIGELVSTERRDERVPIGQRFGSIISDVIEGETFERTFTLYGDTQLDRFEDLRDRRRTLLFQDQHGRGRRAQHYFRFGKQRRLSKLVTQGFETNPIYRATVEMAERPRP
jgi:hypothetical protein